MAGNGEAGAGASLVAMVLVLALGYLPGAALAQGSGLFSGGSDPLADTLAEREEVLETLDTSFARELRARLERARADAGDDLVAFEPGSEIERAREAYLGAASERLFALQGDGSLTLGEVASELPEIREDHVRRFEDIVEARSLGYAPPPLESEFDAFALYAAEMTRYIVIDRNPPAAWGWIVAYALAGVLIALALSGLLSRASRGIAELKHDALAATLDSIRPPLVLAAAAGGLLVGLDVLWLPATVELIARKTLETIVIGLTLIACWNLCDEIADIFAGMARRATGQHSIDHVRDLVQRMLRVLVIVAFLLIVSHVILNASLSGLLTGLGVLGLGLWVLTRGLVENVAASFTLFGDRVFRIGDTVIHGGEWGMIEHIGFRSTRCRTFDGHVLHIPNRNLVADTIRNVSSRPYIRRRFRISIRYDTPPAKIEEAIGLVREVIDDQGERVNRDPGVHVVFDAFGEYDLQLLVEFYTASDDYWTAKEVIGAVNVDIRRRFEASGIEFAFPRRDTVLESDADEPPSLRMEGTIARADGATQEAGDEVATDTGQDVDRGERPRGEPEGAAGNGPRRRTHRGSGRRTRRAAFGEEVDAGDDED